MHGQRIVVFVSHSSYLKKGKKRRTDFIAFSYSIYSFLVTITYDFCKLHHREGDLDRFADVLRVLLLLRPGPFPPPCPLEAPPLSALSFMSSPSFTGGGTSGNSPSSQGCCRHSYAVARLPGTKLSIGTRKSRKPCAWRGKEVRKEEMNVS